MSAGHTHFHILRSTWKTRLPSNRLLPLPSRLISPRPALPFSYLRLTPYSTRMSLGGVDWVALHGGHTWHGVINPVQCVMSFSDCGAARQRRVWVSVRGGMSHAHPLHAFMNSVNTNLLTDYIRAPGGFLFRPLPLNHHWNCMCIPDAVATLTSAT